MIEPAHMFGVPFKTIYLFCAGCNEYCDNSCTKVAFCFFEYDFFIAFKIMFEQDEVFKHSVSLNALIGKQPTVTWLHWFCMLMSCAGLGSGCGGHGGVKKNNCFVLILRLICMDFFPLLNDSL